MFEYSRYYFSNTFIANLVIYVDKKIIFTKFEHMAKGVAQNAGNGKTIHHTAKKAGYFSHHHPAKTVKMKNGKNKSVKKDGHAFYLGK